MPTYQIKQEQAVGASEPVIDRVTPTKTIYDVSLWNVFFRNVIAGMGRAIGGVFIYVFFLSFASLLFMQFALPVIRPFLNQYLGALDAIQDLRQTQPGIQDLWQQIRP